MAFKRPLSILPLPSKNNNKTTSTKLNCCLVCGDEARFNNYGALSCLSCKTFFRRNGFRPELVCPCRYNGECEVNILTRHMCTACRLNKCFSVGMTSHLIRKEDYHVKFNKTQVSKSKTIMPVSQLSTLDLLQNDRSTLTTSEWTLISNILHAYDTFSVIPKLHQIFKNLSSLPNEVRYDVNGAICAFEAVGYMLTSMESLISSIPDFQILTLNEQRSLLQRNLQGVSGFYSQLVFRETDLLKNPKCFQSYTIAYGSKTIKQLNHLVKRIDPDLTLFKLMLVMITFSSNCSILHVHENMHNDSLIFGTFRLLGSQNVYVELLWKYMIYRYGYFDTILRFHKLVKQILDMMKHSATVYTSNEIHHDLIDNFVEKTKEKLIICQNEVIPLWGNTLRFN